MKSTTKFPPMKVGKNQVLLPSGVKMSKDGKYRYWQCSVSGAETFASKSYWEKVMTKFGTEENLVKTYVSRKAQKLLNDGLSQADIIASVQAAATFGAREDRREARRVKAERKAVAKKVRKPRTPSLKSFAVASVEMEVQNETGSFVKEEVPVYPWQSDPNYFKSALSVLSVEETTKDACLFPARHLDDECRGCPIYDKCALSIKFTEKDWNSGKKARAEVVVKPLVVD